MMWLYFLLAIGALYLASSILSRRKQKKVLERWAEKSRETGKVILHGMYGNSEFLPTPSPFVLKLETFLRFANIPYELDKIDMWGPKGKSPWISFEGEHTADSHFIIEELTKKFKTRTRTQDSDVDGAVATLARIAVEEHLYWTGVMWRFAFGGQMRFECVRAGKTSLFLWLLFKFAIGPQMRSMAWAQGVGRHSEAEVISLMCQDLHAISAVLGEKKFLGGNEPCADDCSVFAGLASAVFMPNSPVESELNGELKNLKEYCFRMRDKYWPDWTDVIKKSKKD